jgi:hypothetical protein
MEQILLKRSPPYTDEKASAHAETWQHSTSYFRVKGRFTEENIAGIADQMDLTLN